MCKETTKESSPHTMPFNESHIILAMLSASLFFVGLISPDTISFLRFFGVDGGMPKYAIMLTSKGLSVIGVRIPMASMANIFTKAS